MKKELLRYTHTLFDRQTEEKISPEKTAIHRKSPSLPLKTIFGELKETYKIMDYGCGHGFDVAYLKDKGFKVSGYDKYIKSKYNTEKASGMFDVVNCFYVLNVISKETERIKVLEDIKRLLDVEGVVYISVRSEEEFKRQKGNFTPFRDGIITSKNTFQKYFTDEEFKNLLVKVFKEEQIEKLKISKTSLLYKVVLESGEV